LPEKGIQTMKIAFVVLMAGSLSAGPAFAQESSSTGGLPESLRIEQNTMQENASDPNMPANRSAHRPTTEAPSGSSGPVEMNRIDPAAPSPNRLQIDDGASAAARQNPDVNAQHPGSAGTSYNSIVRSSPSTNSTSTGASSGTSGGAGSSGGSR
jgi:hypothetical protein